MLPGALRLQSFQFMQRSEHRSGKRSFLSPEVFEWFWKSFQHARRVE